MHCTRDWITLPFRINVVTFIDSKFFLKKVNSKNDHDTKIQQEKESKMIVQKSGLRLFTGLHLFWTLE